MIVDTEVIEDLDSPPAEKGIDNDGVEPEEARFVAKPEDRGDILDEETDEEPEANKDAKFDPEILAEIAEGKDDKPITIPKWRFDDVNTRAKDAEARAKALEEENARLKAGQKTDLPAGKKDAGTPEPNPINLLKTQIKEKMRAKNVAIQDADNDLADKLDDEVFALQEKLVEVRAQEISTKALEAARAKDAIALSQQSAVEYADRIIKENPYLGEKGDANAVTAFCMWRDHHRGAGMGLKEAMAEALKEVQRVYGPLHGVAAGTVSEPDAGVKRTALEKKLAAAKQQPPRPSSEGVGVRAAEAPGAKKVADMTEEEFAALTPAERRRARGDDV